MGPGQAFWGHFSLGWGLGPRASEGSPPWDPSRPERGPRAQFFILPDSFQGE